MRGEFLDKNRQEVIINFEHVLSVEPFHIGALVFFKEGGKIELRSSFYEVQEWAHRKFDED
ncbi:hypothetical protein [Brucella anthropi]|uniref:hypothetical protein n=1 Tax=Brucella anthropi TaxID=529 RepID=UPI00056789BF|nr:hypothetical protein [Brucella anthropi]